MEVRLLLELVPPVGGHELEHVVRGGHEHRVRLRLGDLLHRAHPRLLPRAVLPMLQLFVVLFAHFLLWYLPGEAGAQSVECVGCVRLEHSDDRAGLG